MTMKTTKATQNTPRHSVKEVYKEINGCVKRDCDCQGRSSGTHIRCHHTHNDRSDDASNGTNSVGQRHETSRVIRTQIQTVDLHARIEGAHNAHGDGEQGDHDTAVTASVGGGHDEDSGTDTAIGEYFSNLIRLRLIVHSLTYAATPVNHFLAAVMVIRLLVISQSLRNPVLMDTIHMTK